MALKRAVRALRERFERGCQLIFRAMDQIGGQIAGAQISCPQQLRHFNERVRLKRFARLPQHEELIGCACCAIERRLLADPRCDQGHEFAGMTVQAHSAGMYQHRNRDGGAAATSIFVEPRDCFTQTIAGSLFNARTIHCSSHQAAFRHGTP